MNRKQQTIKTRHVIDGDAMEAYTAAIAVKDEKEQRIQSARLLLHNYLRPHEIRRLNEALVGQLPGMQVLILDRWFEWVIAREAVIKADCRVRSNYKECKSLDWANWDQAKAVKAARDLGLVVVTDRMTENVVSVELPI